MIVYVVGGLVGIGLVVAFLMRDGGGVVGASRHRVGGVGFWILLVLSGLVAIAGSISCSLGGLCLVLKLIGVDPVVTWSWGMILGALFGGLVASVAGRVGIEALK
jgi:hypothetical protein